MCMIDVDKDPLRAERLNEVYRHLFAHFGIKTQKQMAERLKVQRTALSAAFNGNKAYLTKNLFMKICAAFPGVFNLDYLLNGEGHLLTPDEECKSSIIESSSNYVDEQNAILEVYARMIRGIDDLRQELKKELDEVQLVKAELHQARDDFRAALYRLAKIADKISNYNINNDNNIIGIAAEK